MRPRSSERTEPSSSPPRETRRAAFLADEPFGQLPVQHRRQRHNPTCPHPLQVHVTAAPVLPNIERSAYAWSVLVQVDLLSPERHLSGYWMWYMGKVAINSRWVPVCCLPRLRCTAPCLTFCNVDQKGITVAFSVTFRKVIHQHTQKWKPSYQHDKEGKRVLHTYRCPSFSEGRAFLALAGLLL